MARRSWKCAARTWWEFEQVNNAPAGCRYFSETKHSLCEPFLSYWNNNGGLARFGFPITEPFEETISGWTGRVQYFERRRMEHHTENRGTPYEVQLGLLGRDVFYNQPGSLFCDNEVDEIFADAYNTINIDYFRNRMGCPGRVYEDIPGAYQNFANGQMIWTQITEEDPRIFGFVSYGGGSGYYYAYRDTWTASDGETPAGDTECQFEPRRGFGKIWGSDLELRNALGCPTQEREQSTDATVQMFDDGMMILLEGTATLYIFGPDSWEAVALSQYRLP
ncbi:MAG: hypothetical protein HC893_13845 [Chloroflexaceae bacterium]|nr:hypothetical protein [Chloroflexaceae bacterium]